MGTDLLSEYVASMKLDGVLTTITNEIKLTNCAIANMKEMISSIELTWTESGLEDYLDQTILDQTIRIFRHQPEGWILQVSSQLKFDWNERILWKERIIEYYKLALRLCSRIKNYCLIQVNHAEDLLDIAKD